VESGRAFIRNESSDDDPFEIQTLMPSPNESQRVVSSRLKKTKIKTINEINPRRQNDEED
jgi:hypothetical protein